MSPTPFFQDEHLTVYHGDAREVMASMEPDSVHCVVTSPPYWGLRDYGEPGQLGLEPTPEEYVANMVEVFREVRRVLRADGTVWLNLGDGYTSGGRQTRDPGKSKIHPALEDWQGGRPGNPAGLKDKDLVGIPWRVAFALQADGWYLRSDIIWSKPNPMPESVTDRPTKSHEYLFLLSKSPRYYFDAEAVREEATHAGKVVTLGPKSLSKGQATGMAREASGNGRADTVTVADGRNIRSVWTVATQPYPGAHFATFPQKLIEPCIKAGTSEQGVCPECGAPFVRVTQREPNPSRWASDPDGARGFPKSSDGHNVQSSKSMHRNGSDVQGPPATTLGWRHSCEHPWDDIPTPAVVLDPFAGSGTTGLVAQRLGRRAVLIDLSMDYLGQIMARNAQKPLGLVG